MANYKNQFDSLPQYEKDNKVHHLGINASQIAPGVILTSNLERTQIIANAFDKAEKVGEHREYITYTGETGGVAMSAMSIGNGCMPTAIAVEELRHIGCMTMIKAGSCVAIQPDIKPGTIIIPTAAARDEGATIEYLNLQFPAVADIDVFFALTESARELGVPLTEGIVRTHDALFMASLHGHGGLKERIRPWQELGVLAMDNEVAAMFAIASILGSRAGALLVVTENIATGETIQFDKDYPKLTDAVIAVAIRALQKTGKAGMRE